MSLELLQKQIFDLFVLSERSKNLLFSDLALLVCAKVKNADQTRFFQWVCREWAIVHGEPGK